MMLIGLSGNLNVLGVPLSDIILMYQEDNSNLVVYTINEIEKNLINALS